MKRLLYSSLMALMMLFAVGSANAQKVTIKLGSGNVPGWVLGSEDVLNFVITITENEGDGVTPIALGTEAGNFAVKVAFLPEGKTDWNDAVTTQTLTATPTALVTTAFTELAKYDLDYKLVKGDNTDADFENAAVEFKNNTRYFEVVSPYTVEIKNGLFNEAFEDPYNVVALYYPSIFINAYKGNNELAEGEFYYVFLADGEEMTDATQPTRANYNAEGNTKVKKAIGFPSQHNPNLVNYNIYTDDATAKTVKIKGYLHPKAVTGGDDDLLSVQADGDTETPATSDEYETQIYSLELDFGDASKTATPIFDPASGEVELGATVTITNLDDAIGEAETFGMFTERPGEIFYTIDGKTPLYAYSSGYDEDFGIAIDGTPGDEITIKAVAFVRDDETGMMKVSDVATGTYTIKVPVKNDPTLTVAIASNGTMGTDNKVTFNGMAKFTTVVTDVPQGKELSNYSIKVTAYPEGQEGANYQPIEVGEFDATATAGDVELNGVYNGNYEVVFVLCERVTNVSGEESVDELDADTTFNIIITNYEEVVEAIPTLTVAIASNGTMGTDNKVTFNGMAKFTTVVTDVPQGKELSNYSIKVTAYPEGQEGENYQPIGVGDFDATATAGDVELNGVYNGNYEVVFVLCERVTNVSGEESVDELDADTAFNVIITNYAEPIPPVDPDLTVTAAGKNTTADDGKITFEGIAAFNMAATGDLIAGDSLGNYTITFELYTPKALDTMGPYITTYSSNAADTTNGVVKAELVGVYNGEYGAYIYLTRINGMVPEELAGGISIKFAVTEYPEPEVVDPTFAVAAAGKNEMKENTVVFDGMAEFTMAVGEMSEGDSLQIAAVLYTKINFDTFGQPITTDYYAVDATKAEFNGVYNGEYAVRFELQRYSLMLRDFSEVTDTVIYFNVTNYEQPEENYTVTIKPVGATMNADTAAYTGNVVFDILVGGLQEKDTMTLATTIFTKIDFDTNANVDPRTVVDAKDSVRFDARLSDGEYVAVVELKRANAREDMVVEFATLYLTVSGVAVERNAELAGVNVYPNPSNGTFNVAVPERARIDIFGLNGAKVMSREANAGVESFSINHSGIYFVRVMAGNKAAVKRVVVR